MLPKIDKKTVKAVAQVATFAAVTVCLALAYNNCIPTEYANNLGVRIGKAVVYMGAVKVSTDAVGKLFDDSI